MLEATESSLATDLDLAGLVESRDEAEDNSCKPELVGQLCVSLDICELVCSRAIQLFVYVHSIVAYG